MQEPKEGEFIANIIRILHENGYPDKRVTLPLEKMYEVAHEKGINFNKVLEFLKDQMQIDHEKTTEKLIFYPKEEKEPEPTAAGGEDPMQAFMNMGPDVLKNLNFPEIMDKASEMVKNLKPEQLAEYKKMFMEMTEEERKEMMKKAKELGLFK